MKPSLSHIYLEKNQPFALLRSLSNQAARTEPFLEQDLKSDLGSVQIQKERSYNRNSRLGAKYSLKGKHAYITRKTCSGAKWKAWENLNIWKSFSLSLQIDCDCLRSFETEWMISLFNFSTLILSDLKSIQGG